MGVIYGTERKFPPKFQSILDYPFVVRDLHEQNYFQRIKAILKKRPCPTGDTILHRKWWVNWGLNYTLIQQASSLDVCFSAVHGSTSYLDLPLPGGDICLLLTRCHLTDKYTYIRIWYITEIKIWFLESRSELFPKLEGKRISTFWHIVMIGWDNSCPAQRLVTNHSTKYWFSTISPY